MDPQVLIVLLPFFLFHIFSTIFIANPLKQDFFVNRCHHYQVLARINKNSALSVSLSRPQWKYCMKKMNKKNCILLFSLRLISRNVTHHPYFIMHQHILTQSFFEDIISSSSVSVVETSQNKFWIHFFDSACRNGSERRCDSICSVCLDLGIFLNTRFALDSCESICEQFSNFGPSQTHWNVAIFTILFQPSSHPHTFK